MEISMAKLIALIKALGGGGGGGGGVEDVLLNGQSIVNAQGKANIPAASGNTLGVVKATGSGGNGISINSSNELIIARAESADIKSGTYRYRPITPVNQHESVFYALAKLAGADMKDIQSPTVGVYPELQKSAISQMLSAPETVSGSTPSITAKPGVQYICGEVSTIDITVPATGIIDVIFESGSTPAVLTVTPPTGKTMKWAGGFDPTSLEANTVYKINITVAGSYCLGTATLWA